MKTLRRLLKLLLARPETRLVLGAATLLLALSAHAEEAHGEHAIEINWWGWPNNEHPPLGWLIVNFAIFMFLLVRFAKKPMVAGMAKRPTRRRRILESSRHRGHHPHSCCAPKNPSHTQPPC